MRRRPDIGTTIMGRSRIRDTDRSATAPAGVQSGTSTASILKPRSCPCPFALTGADREETNAVSTRLDGDGT
jgi:hypothetical protein